MKIFLKSYSSIDLKVKGINFVFNYNHADKYNLSMFIYKNELINYKTLYINKYNDVFCFDLDIIGDKNKKYFYIGNLNELDIEEKIIYFFSELYGIGLKNLTHFSKNISINREVFSIKNILNINEFLKTNYENNTFLIKDNILNPRDLNVSENLSKLYNLVNKKLGKVNNINNFYFNDFILSLIDYRYWINSLFFLNSNLKFKISSFYNKYDDIISLQIPVARSKFLSDLFDSLLLQSNQNFKIILGVDGYDKKQKDSIVKIINKYKDRFLNFDYFVNRKNIGVGKTRWKLLEKDYKSKYPVFLDDDVFLDINAIDNLYKFINKNRNIGLYSIENIDVKYNINYKYYIFKKGGFQQPGVHTNRERVSRLPIYVNKEETPVIFDRFYRDLLDHKYHKSFDKCSLDLFYNRTLEIICGNINIKGIFQFNRVGHKYHQTQENGFLPKEFEYTLYILDKVYKLNNINIYYDILTKLQIPKQNDLFK